MDAPPGPNQAVVTAYQLAWNLEKNVGSVRLWVEGRDESHERELDSADFVAVAALLSSPRGVIVGKSPDGQSYMFSRKVMVEK